ncbi:MAG: hypothetical protein HC800_25420 [Phormidesmis sp. RL_2_1]|nr:hypothetical protein [Phormidesmis sp. RL_2_1]
MREVKSETKGDRHSFLAGAIVGGFLVFIALAIEQSFNSASAPTACEVVTAVNDDYRLIVSDATRENQAIGEEFGPEIGAKYYYQISGGPMPQELESFLDLAEEMAEECSDGSYLWGYPTLKQVKSRSKYFNPDGTPRE